MIGSFTANIYGWVKRSNTHFNTGKINGLHFYKLKPRISHFTAAGLAKCSKRCGYKGDGRGRAQATEAKMDQDKAIGNPGPVLVQSATDTAPLAREPEADTGNDGATAALPDEMMVMGEWGEVTVFRKHFHYLDLMANRLEAQVDYIHKKQSIIFSLSAGILAVLFYSEQSVLVMLPFFVGLVLALWSVVPAFAGTKRQRDHPDIYYFGGLPESMSAVRNMPTQNYADAMLQNLRDVVRLVRQKNRLIAWAARSFFVGVSLLLGVAGYRHWFFAG